MTTPVPIVVAGALGRMGRAVVAASQNREDVRLCALFDRADAQGHGLSERATALDQACVAIDFSTAAASLDLALFCAARGRPSLVIGSTGWTAAQDAELRAAAERIAIVRAGNFSLGVNLIAAMVRQAAHLLGGPDYDIEISEAHHRGKLDAPSGTALMLGESAAQGRGVELDLVAERGRDGIGAGRDEGAIGFSVVRGGGIVGEHSVLFAAEDELITFSHSARDRSLFARGALAAAVWVADRAPGLYDMQDVLGLAR